MVETQKIQGKSVVDCLVYHLLSTIDEVVVKLEFEQMERRGHVFGNFFCRLSGKEADLVMSQSSCFEDFGALATFLLRHLIEESDTGDER